MKNRGFTIIEFLVVISIMGILAAVTAFSYRKLFTKSRLEETMNEVRAFYEGVNRKAVTDGYRYTILVNRDKDLLKYISFDGLKQDSLIFQENLDVVFSGAVNSIHLIVHVDGFVKDEDNIRDFSLIDTTAGKSINFYISPLGVLEARIQ